MWWASYWIHVERLPWELGADCFFRHLLDADPASNTLSWRWVAGLQTPGKTYLVRKSNIERYAPDLLRRTSAGVDRLADGAVAPVVAVERGNAARQALPDNRQRLRAARAGSGCGFTRTTCFLKRVRSQSSRRSQSQRSPASIATGTMTR
jgi:hypothetical protein